MCKQNLALALEGLEEGPVKILTASWAALFKAIKMMISNTYQNK
jgi:hypothetical protein